MKLARRDVDTRQYFDGIPPAVRTEMTTDYSEVRAEEIPHLIEDNLTAENDYIHIRKMSDGYKVTIRTLREEDAA